MAKVLLAVVARINHKKRFMRQLSVFEQQGYSVHLFEDETWENIHLDSLHGAMSYLEEELAKHESCALLCNNQALLFAWYRRDGQLFSEYFLYVDEEVESGMEYLIHDRAEIEALNDFSSLSNDFQRKPVQVIFEQWQHVLKMIAKYLAFVEPYGVRRTLQPKVERQAAWDNIFAGRAVDYIMKMYRVPKAIAYLLFLPFFHHTLQRNDLVHVLLADANAALISLKPSLKKAAVAYLDSLSSWFTPQCSASLYSLLYEAVKDKKYIRELLSLRLADQLDHRERSEAFWTILRMSFVGKLGLDFEENVLLRKYYQNHVAKIAAEINLPSVQPKQMRNSNRIVVMTDQFLSIQHAPTRNVLDYSRNLRKLGKEVLIINAAGMPRTSKLALCEGARMNFVSEYSQFNSVSFEGEDYPFYQSKEEMPNLKDIQTIVDQIADFNPEFVVEVGNGTLAAAVCSYFTTVVTIPCGSGLPLFAGSLWAVARKTLPEDSKFLQAFDIPEEKVFSIHYSFMKKEKSVKLTRSQLRLPEDAFVICIVGNRLDEEVTDRFAEDLVQFVREIPAVYFLFIGAYSGYDNLISRQPLLAEKSGCTGQREDIQSIYELCNAYLNPERSGGATSGAEAMLEGLPVLTKPYGDVYYQLWLDRSFANADGMIAFIKKCIAEPKFYEEQAENTRKQGKVLFDTGAMMRELLAHMNQCLR